MNEETSTAAADQGRVRPTWATWDEIAPVFDSPTDPDWANDLEAFDSMPKDPWAQD